MSTYIKERIILKAPDGAQVASVEAERIGGLFIHRSADYEGRYFNVTAPCGWALGWFKNRREALKVAKDVQALFPVANWKGKTLDEIFPALEDRRAAYDLITPRRAQ